MKTGERPTLLVCMNRRFGSAPCCAARGAQAVFDALDAAAPACGIAVEPSPCLGNCAHGPNVKLVPDGELHAGMTPATAAALMAKIAGG